VTVDLATRYLGLELRSPIVASAAPHNADPAMAKLLERAGVAAIVLPSLFEEEILAEEIELNRSLEQGTEHFAEALDYFPDVQGFMGAADRYVAALERIKSQAGVPIIASLNATSVGGWVDWARRMSTTVSNTLMIRDRKLVGGLTGVAGNGFVPVRATRSKKSTTEIPSARVKAATR